VTIAASSGAAALGTIGLGGLALILATWFWLGTRKKSKNGLSAQAALTLGLISGAVWMSAGQVWGVPDDLVLRALGSTQKTDALGDIGYGAISITMVIVAYCINFKPRAAGYIGIMMATVFTQTGGLWADITEALREMAVGFAS